MKDVHAEPNPGTVVEKETGTLFFFSFIPCWMQGLMWRCKVCLHLRQTVTAQRITLLFFSK